MYQKGWEACDDVVLAATNVLIMGDSHAVDALNALYKVYPTHNYSMSQLDSCPPYDRIEKITLANHPDRIKCKILNKARYDPSYLRQFDYIVINVLYDWYTFDHLFEYLQFLKFNNVQKVIIMGNYLVLNKDMPELLNKYGYNEQQITPWVRDNIFNELRVKSRVNELGYFYISKKINSVILKNVSILIQIKCHFPSINIIYPMSLHLNCWLISSIRLINIWDLKMALQKNLRKNLLNVLSVPPGAVFFKYLYITCDT